MKVVVAVYDKKAMFYSGLMVMENEIMAKRNFFQAVSSADNMLHNYPEDFCLMRLGVFDERLGKIVMDEYNTNIAEAVSAFDKPSKSDD